MYVTYRVHLTGPLVPPFPNTYREGPRPIKADVHGHTYSIPGIIPERVGSVVVAFKDDPRFTITSIERVTTTTTIEDVTEEFEFRHPEESQ